MALTTKRIIALTTQSDPQEGDYLAIDNMQNGTHKIPVGRVGVEVDDTLTEAGKAADAKATGDALDEIRSQIEVTGTASGAIATFTDGADMPAKSVVVNIVPKQSGSGTPSPENVRPISGWESVTVADYAVNMLTEQTNEKRPCFIKAGTSITASAKKEGTGDAFFYYYRADGTQIDYWALSRVEGERYYRTVTMPEDVYFIAFLGQSGVTLSERQIALSPTIEYSETLAHVATTSLDRTVYGGTLDIASGVLTVDKGFATFDGSSDEIWFNNGSVGVYTPKASLPNVKPVWSGVTILSNQYTQIVSGQAPTVNGKFNWNDNMNALQFRNDNALSATDFRAALAQNPVTIVYPLETPQTYQLTPTEIQTLLGENNVWADAGDVEVVYVRDLNIAINNLLNSNGTRSLGMMAMSAPTKDTAEEPTDEQTEEPAEDDMR